MANAQITTSVTIINSGLIGYQGISLTDFTASTVSAIAAGSGIEIASAFFKFSTDETINASSWTAITTATTAYLTLTPSGTAGSQILSAAWSSSAPVWSTSKQGWYTSAGSNIRVVASAYKGSATQYLNKFILDNCQDTGFKGIEERITTGSGNWTVPSGVHRIRVKCIGGGGGGGGNGGGGGGTDIGSISWSIINVIPGQSISYSVGSGGSGGSGAIGSDGGNGNSTTFTGATTGLGGGGGSGLLNSSAGGAGASNAGGSAGVFGVNNKGGPGGGAGGAGGLSGNSGTNGNYGGGGGGSGDGAVTGGTGGSGIIIIEY